jgi:hypothetical protein
MCHIWQITSAGHTFADSYGVVDMTEDYELFLSEMSSR